MADAQPEQLYQSREPIHPRSVKGPFRTFKTGVLLLAYGVFFLLPWVRWERLAGPDQAVMFDIPTRRYFLFDLTVYPQDMYWLAGFLILAAWFLFFITGIFGRAFCGYFCFQTLWTDLFMKIEQLVQGERPARMRLEKESWGLHKLTRKGLTWFLWIAVAFWTGFTFTAYWANAPELFVDFFTGQAPFAAYVTTFLLTATTTVMAGFAREQVCIYMCPYSRFQSVMFDKNTLIPTYDYNRGEGRSKPFKGLKTREEREEQGVGDCIDCGYCVQVCPTGIDIRDGLQIACINCGLCVDACDTIMDKQGWPRGLIRYASEKEIETGEKSKILRPKTIGYGFAISVVTALLIWGIASQSPMDFAVNQVRQPLYVTLSDGRIQNSYELKVNNKQDRPVDLDIALEGLPNPEMEFAGNIEHYTMEPSGRQRILIRVKHEPAGMKGKQPIRFVLTDENSDMAPIVGESVFYLP